MNRTKIVATIGPVSDSEEMIAQMLKAGANVIRFNMKHGTVEWHEERIARVQKVADELHVPVGILIDLQGPEVRIETVDKNPLLVKKDEEVWLATSFHPEKKGIRVAQEGVITALEVGDEVLIDDGFFEFEVVKKEHDGLVIRARGDYSVGNRKGMNLPGVKLDLASLIDDDLKKLDMATKQHVDFVALSFVRDTKDIEILRAEMDKRHIKAQICAKIENASALENLDSIIAMADNIMIARGDLGIETPFEELAYWQKTMVYKCRLAGKSVITATQMLQSMVDQPRPTRAEVSDVANAVFDGTDAVMLSGETANGRYPALAVATQRRIANFNEDKVELPPISFERKLSQTETITEAAMSIVNDDPEIGAVVVFTETGTTARMLSRFRPQIPIIALTRDSKARDQLSLAYGVMPFLMDFPEGDISVLGPIIEQLKVSNIVKKGERVLFIHGARWKEPGLTNTLAIHEIV